MFLLRLKLVILMKIVDIMTLKISVGMAKNTQQQHLEIANH